MAKESYVTVSKQAVHLEANETMATEAHDNERADDALDLEIYAWLKKTGHVIPTTPEDVLRAEKALGEQFEALPEELADPEILLRRLDQQEESEPLRIVPLSSPEQGAVEKALARAARQGSEIPPEIEERMRRDRESHKKDD